MTKPVNFRREIPSYHSLNNILTVIIVITGLSIIVFGILLKLNILKLQTGISLTFIAEGSLLIALFFYIMQRTSLNHSQVLIREDQKIERKEAQLVVKSRDAMASSSSAPSEVSVPDGCSCSLLSLKSGDILILIKKEKRDVTIVPAQRYGCPWGLYALGNRSDVCLWNRDTNKSYFLLEQVSDLITRKELDLLFQKSRWKDYYITIGTFERGLGEKRHEFTCHYPHPMRERYYEEDPNLSNLVCDSYLSGLESLRQAISNTSAV